MANLKLKNQIKKAPNKSGVYLFKDKNKKVLYVGRAVFLRSRLRNYFSSKIDSRLKEMIGLTRFLEYKRTDNLLEAIILEASLIKKYWPKYNIRQRDNRSFVYLVIEKNKFSKPFIIRGRELEKFSFNSNFEIFGPFQSYSLLKNVLKVIRRIFPYSTCQINSGKPCFDYQIGLCPGACLGKISQKDYQKNINNLILLFKGKKKKLLEILKKENPEKIYSLNQIQDVALLEKEGFLPIVKKRIEGYDISHLSGKETVGAMVVFTNNQPDKKEYRLFKIKKAPPNDDLRALEEIIIRRFNHLEWPKPDLILIDGGQPQLSFISKILKEKKIKIPIVGISKFKNDKLVFIKGAKPSFRKMIESIKNVLLKVREEAHRFAISFHRRKRKI